MGLLDKIFNKKDVANKNSDIENFTQHSSPCKILSAHIAFGVKELFFHHATKDVATVIITDTPS